MYYIFVVFVLQPVEKTGEKFYLPSPKFIIKSYLRIMCEY